ncbi:MAG TPA: hypothetical protein VET25_10685, partial [Aestuariivirgaceae bacterium]|nr:hypothetical protein [Aestuariivirgaceae bacterium]
LALQLRLRRPKNILEADASVAAYLFGFTVCLAARLSFFCLAAALAFACFCAACLFLVFGDLSPMGKYSQTCA